MLLVWMVFNDVHGVHGVYAFGGDDGEYDFDDLGYTHFMTFLPIAIKDIHNLLRS